jgi:hypothetical protein
MIYMCTNYYLNARLRVDIFKAYVRAGKGFKKRVRTLLSRSAAALGFKKVPGLNCFKYTPFEKDNCISN